MTNVLMPTDFTAASLRLAENFIKDEDVRKCNIVLFHAFAMPSSAFDLLATKHRDPVGELMNEPFRQGCKQLKDQYPTRIGKIIVRCMTGDTLALFRNFIEANDIDLIFYPPSYVFQQVHHRSIDPSAFFAKSGVPLIKARPRKPEASFSEQVLSTLQLSTS